MEKKKEKRGAMELLWICMFVFLIFFAVFNTFKMGFRESVPLYLMSLLSLLMFFWRQHLRRTWAKKQAEEDAKNGKNQ